MDFIQDTWSKARRLNKTIILPETEDVRIIKAAEIITRSHLANMILIGEEEKVNEFPPK